MALPLKSLTQIKNYWNWNFFYPIKEKDIFGVIISYNKSDFEIHDNDIILFWGNLGC